MAFAVSPQQAILFTKFSVAIIFTWPPPANSSRLALNVHNILWHLTYISTFLLFIPLLQSAYVHQDDPFIMSQSICLAAACSQVTIKQTLCRALRFRFQALYSEMEEFCANASEEERDVLQRYVNRCKLLHGIYTAWTYIAAAIVVSGPLYTPQPLPCFAVYPFAVDEQPMKTIVYIHQSMMAFQASSGMNVDCQIAILLWFAAVRFDILSAKIRNLPADKYFSDCYKMHQEVLAYARKVRETASYLSASTIITTTVGVAFGGINIIRESTPIVAKIQFSIVIIIASIELFMCALPADQLKNASSQIANDMYNSNWYERSTKERTSAQHLIMRAQKSETITVSGLVSDLSLRYYSSFLYTSVSYVTALRVMIDKEET